MNVHPRAGDAPPASSKLSLTCFDFRALRRNTLVGFSTIKIRELRLEIRDIALHRRGASRWAALPAKPILDKTGAVIRDATSGIISYANIFEFTDRATRDAFSRACIDAVTRAFPDAFEDGEAEA